MSLLKFYKAAQFRKFRIQVIEVIQPPLSPLISFRIWRVLNNFPVQLFFLNVTPIFRLHNNLFVERHGYAL